MSGEEVLGLPGRFEALHLPLSSSRWSMRVLGPIVEISAFSVLDARKQLTLGDAVAPQLVGYDHPRLKLQALKQPFEEARRRLAITPGLNEDVEQNAIPIHGAPEIMLHALDLRQKLIRRSRHSLPMRRAATFRLSMHRGGLPAVAGRCSSPHELILSR
jgi:hypothetical protein